MKTYKIYVLKDPITNEVRYVGFTTELLRRRYAGHLCGARKRADKNCYKENWIRGLLIKNLKPTIELLEECTKDTWEEREKYWISHYRSIQNNLTNISDGGEAVSLGRKIPEKQRLLYCKKVYQYDLEGNFIMEHPSIVDISKSLNINKCTIFKILKYEKGTSNNFQFRRYKTDKISSTKCIKNTCNIYQYSNEGIFIKEWKGATDVQKSLGIKSTNIAKVLRGKRPLAGGFIWKYNFDNNKIISKKSYGKRKVILIDNNIETIFDSTRDLSRYLNVSYKLLSVILNGKIKKSRILKDKIIKYAE